MATEQGLYAQVFMLCCRDLKISEVNENKMKIDIISKVSLKDHTNGLILILIGLKKLLA